MEHSVKTKKHLFDLSLANDPLCASLFANYLSRLLPQVSESFETLLKREARSSSATIPQ
jgi:hypothetical protein